MTGLTVARGDKTVPRPAGDRQQPTRRLFRHNLSSNPPCQCLKVAVTRSYLSRITQWSAYILTFRITWRVLLFRACTGRWRYVRDSLSPVWNALSHDLSRQIMLLALHVLSLNITRKISWRLPLYQLIHRWLIGCGSGLTFFQSTV